MTHTTALLAAMPAAPLVVGWRELMTIGVCIAIIYISYALKEAVATRKLVHITRQGSDEDASGDAS